jgi:putative transcriptional regulator
LKNKLEECRKDLNENQENLANAVGVSRQTIISIEKGKYNPSIILAFKIANHFKKEIKDIFIYEEDNCDE